MKLLDKKLNKLSDKIGNGEPIVIMIMGLGSVGLYLLDYLISLADPNLHIVVVGRNEEKMTRDVNIVKTSALIRHQLRSKIIIESACDLDNIESITDVLYNYKPDFIINSSRVYSGLKYGSISWNKLRAYGIWTPLSVKYAKYIMNASEYTNSDAIVINTSYSDAVIPWLKSVGEYYPDFGSGNLNHLIPRMKFYISQRESISNLNDIDITLATSHFHDVVISKEGHAEGQKLLIDIHYLNKSFNYDQADLFEACMIHMPVDQKRNMMNASSNFDIIYSIIYSLRNNQKVKFHSPGVEGEIGGYPYIVDAKENRNVSGYFDTSVFSFEEMRKANKESIYLDGIENVESSCLFYTDELILKVKEAFQVNLPKKVHINEINEVGDFLINSIIVPYK